MMTLTGPFTQLLPLTDIPVRGKLADEQLSIIPNAGILTDHGKILATGNFNDLREETSGKGVEIHEILGDAICIPGFIDCHTHLLFAGSRAIDYAARNAGRTYQEIGAAGGGIKDTMGKTRAASTEELAQTLTDRLDLHLRSGITTVEVKSGYGLSVDQELRMLRVIKKTGDAHTADVISTCLAAHVIPSEVGDEQEWLRTILKDIVPVVEAEQLASRFDIFVEGGAFTPEYSRPYLKQLKSQGFGITIHGDQFTVGGSQLAIDVGALSVDHLEVSGEKEIMALADSKVIPVALPGASIGLGCAFTPARKLLDAGASLAIASDWNPGSAPMGDLLTQAAILGTFEKLTTAEVLAGLTFRAAAALGLSDRGSLAVGQKADFITFHATDYREILYKQGQLKPNRVWKNGLPVT